MRYNLSAMQIIKRCKLTQTRLCRIICPAVKSVPYTLMQNERRAHLCLSEIHINPEKYKSLAPRNNSLNNHDETSSCEGSHLSFRSLFIEIVSVVIEGKV